MERKYKDRFEQYFNRERCIENLVAFMESQPDNPYMGRMKFLVQKLSNGEVPYCPCGNYPATSDGRIVTNYLIPICPDCLKKLPYDGTTINLIYFIDGGDIDDLGREWIKI